MTALSYNKQQQLHSLVFFNQVYFYRHKEIAAYLASNALLVTRYTPAGIIIRVIAQLALRHTNAFHIIMFALFTKLQTWAVTCAAFLMAPLACLQQEVSIFIQIQLFIEENPGGLGEQSVVQQLVYLLGLLNSTTFGRSDNFF